MVHGGVENDVPVGDIDGRALPGEPRVHLVSVGMAGSGFGVRGPVRALPFNKKYSVPLRARLPSAAAHLVEADVPEAH